MARLTKHPVARTATHDFLRTSLVALAGVLLTALLVTQAAAQQKGPAASSTGLIEDGIDLCGLIVDDVFAAETELERLGWSIDDSYSKSPFIWELDASKIYDDGTDVYIFALIETYPSGEIGYCSFDAQYVPATQNLEAVADIYGVTGHVEEADGGMYGTWEEIADDGVYFVLGEMVDDYFFLQMTRISEHSAPPNGPVK